MNLQGIAKTSFIMTLVLCLTTLILCSFMFTAQAAEIKQPEDFPDMPTGWSKEAMANAVNNGLIYGIDGKLMPKAYLTRAQLASIINRMLQTTERADISKYEDVSESDWFYTDMEKAVSSKTMVGSGNMLFPGSNATREEVFTVLSRAMKLEPAQDLSSIDMYSDASQISSWARGSVAAMVEQGYMFASNNKLEPKMNITREEFVYAIYSIPVAPISETDGDNLSANDNAHDVVIDTSISNVSIDGDLIVSGSSPVTLDNVSVLGKISISNGDGVVFSGGTKTSEVLVSSEQPVSIKIIDSEIGAITIDKAGDSAAITGRIGAVNINCDVPVALSHSSIASLNINSKNSYVAVSDSSSITELNINEGAIYSQTSIEGGSNVSKVTIDSVSAAVTANDASRINSITINQEGAGSAVTFSGASVVENVKIGAIDVYLMAKDASKIANVVINPEAINTIIDIDSESEITNLIDEGQNTFMN